MNTGIDNRIRETARVLTVIFHPVFVPLYGLLIIFSSPTLLSFIPAAMKRVILIVVFTNNVLIPLSLTAILYARGAIKTFSARDRNERVVLLTFALLMYSITAVVLLRMQVPSLFKAYFISIAIVTLITLVITAFYRISLHASGIGGLLALVVFMMILYDIRSVWQLIAVIIAGGLVMSSRLYLDDHSPAEVWLGLLAGTAVMAVSLFCLLK
jgi:hypothetical protein